MLLDGAGRACAWESSSAALTLALIFAGVGFAVHVLWIVALVLFVLWLVGLGVDKARDPEGWVRYGCRMTTGLGDPLGIRRPACDRATDDPGRTESEQERHDRNLLELLQELRVASIGVQVLFGFLLALPFSARFARLDLNQRHLYLAVILTAALAIALFSAPVAYHRINFRHRRRAQLLRAAHVLAPIGLAAVATSICGAVLLVTGAVLRGPAVPLPFLVTVSMFVGLWLVLPLSGRHRSVDGDPGVTGRRQ